MFQTEGTVMDVLCLGELMIDFIAEEPGDLKQAMRFFRSAGGSAANVAAAVKKLGYLSAFIGKVGNDPFGDFLSEQIAAMGIDMTHLVRDPDRRTSIAFVALDENKIPDYYFFRKGSANINLKQEEIDEEFIRRGRILYFSSICLTDEPIRGTTSMIVETAQASGLDIVFDPNLRFDLWLSEEHLRNEILRMISSVSILKINIDEWRFLWGNPVHTDILFTLFKENPRLKLVALTMGCDGSILLNSEGDGIWFGSLTIPVVDTTGAGDSYGAALSVALLSSGGQTSDIESYGLFASAASELVVQKRGVIPALPSVAEVRMYLKENKRSRCIKKFSIGEQIELSSLLRKDSCPKERAGECK
jgi:fructokinase